MRIKISLSAPMVCFAIILFALTGCATVDQNVNLNYSTVERSFGLHSGNITVSRNDTETARNNKGEWIIGSINNVHGVHKADVVSDRNVAEWITEALVLELKRIGYSVKYAGKLPANSSLGILISDIKTSLNIDQGTVSDDVKQELKFNIDIYLSGIKAKTFNVSSRENKTLPFSVSKEEKETIMLQSLQDAIQQIIPEINAVTGK